MVRRLILTLLVCLGYAVPVMAYDKVQGWCENGGTAVTVPGTTGSGTQRFQQTYRSCMVTVYNASTVTLATIFSDSSGTAQANPLPASATGQWSFYANSGDYDIRFSAGGITTPFTLGGFQVTWSALSASGNPGTVYLGNPASGVYGSVAEARVGMYISQAITAATGVNPTQTEAYGSRHVQTLTNTANSGRLYGMAIEPTLVGAFTDTTYNGVFVSSNVGTNATIATFRLGMFDTPSLQSGATVTDAYGIYVNSISAISGAGIRRALQTAGGDHDFRGNVRATFTDTASDTIINSELGGSQYTMIQADTPSASRHPIFSLSSNRTDAAGNPQGYLVWDYQTNSATHKDIAAIGAWTLGTTANQRGGQMIFTIKPDGSATQNNYLQIDSTGTVINEDSNDHDFRYESNGNANHVYFDANAFGGVGSTTFGTNADTTAPFAVESPAITATSNSVFYRAVFIPIGAVTITAGTTSSLVATASFAEPNITATGSVTLAATVHILNEPTEGTTNYAEYIQAGDVRWAAYGAGTATFDGNGVITSVSDERLKTIAGAFKTGLSGILKLRPIIYNWTKASGLDDKYTYLGFGAQNVRSALGPLAVGMNSAGYYSIQDRAIIAALVNASKELSNTVTSLRKRIVALEKR